MSTTLKDLAAAAGLSIRSVRRALAGEPGVSPEARQKVAELAQELGYVPNIAARNLRMQQSPFVGILSTADGAEVFIRRGQDLIRRLEDHGFYPLIAQAPSTPESAAELARRWAGICHTMIWQKRPDAAILEILPSLPQNFIIIDAEVSGANYCSLAIDRSAGIHEAVRSLLDGGRKNIIRCGNIQTREAGFRTALETMAGMKDPDAHVLQSVANEFEDGYRAAPEILRRGADAVFFDVDRMAFGFLRYAWEHRIAVPNQVAVIGFDNDPYGVYSCPALSTVAQPISEANGKIVELVRDGVTPNRIWSYPTRFIPRESSTVKI